MRIPDVETLTDFLRDHKRVLKKVDKHDVVLHRTGGKPAVRLSLETRASVAELGMRLLADAVAAVPEGVSRGDLMERHFPWVLFLPPNDRALFESSFVKALRASVSLGTIAKLDELLGDWKATALVHADPAVAADLKRPIAAGGEIPVPRPVASPTRRAQKR